MAGNITSLNSGQYLSPAALGDRGAIIGNHSESGSNTRVGDKDKVTLSSEANKITAEYKSDKQTIETTYSREKQNLQNWYNRELQQLEAGFRQDKAVVEIA